MPRQDIELRDNFLFTLEWLLAVTQRYKDHIRFGLVHVNFANPRILGDMFGAQEAAHKLDEVLHTMQKAFRKTDLIARDGVDFWILAPYTETEGKLADKVKYIIDVGSQNGLHIVERDISFFSLPFEGHEFSENFSAADFLAYLKDNHIAIERHAITCPPGG